MSESHNTLLRSPKNTHLTTHCSRVPRSTKITQPTTPHRKQPNAFLPNRNLPACPPASPRNPRELFVCSSKSVCALQDQHRIHAPRVALEHLHRAKGIQAPHPHGASVETGGGTQRCSFWGAFPAVVGWNPKRTNMRLNGVGFQCSINCMKKSGQLPHWLVDSCIGGVGCEIPPLSSVFMNLERVRILG